MAYNNKKNKPNGGFYEEVSFKPFIDTLRNESLDDTPLNDNYVGFYRNVYDMISYDDNDDKIIKKIKYDSTTKSFIITFTDGSIETVTLLDNYLLTASYSHINGIATFVLNNGDIVKLDLNELRNKLVSKEEFNNSVTNLSVKIENLNNKIEILNNKIESGTTSLQWGKY